MFLIIVAPMYFYYNRTIMIDSLDELDILKQIISVIKISEERMQRSFFHSNIVEYLKGTYDDEDFSDILMFSIIYETRDGAHVMGYISAPADYLENEYPILIRNRGGANVTGSDVSSNTLISRGVTWASRGYIVLQTYYRTGSHLIEGIKHDQWGGDDINDILTLMDISESFSFKANEMYMIGDSRGGMMTYMILRRDKRIDAAVSVNGVASASEHYAINAWRGALVATGGTPAEVPQEYYKRSAVRWADEIKTPLLIMHGRLDDVVPLNQSIRVYNLMNSAGRDVTLEIFDDVGHSFTGEMGLFAHEWIQARRAQK